MFKLRWFGGVVVTERAWLLTEAGSGESVIQSLQCSCALCAIIQNYVSQFGPGGMSGNFGSKGCTLVLTCFTETGFPVRHKNQLPSTP